MMTRLYRCAGGQPGARYCPHSDLNRIAIVAAFHGMRNVTLQLGRSLSLPLSEDRPAAVRENGQATGGGLSSRAFGRAKMARAAQTDESGLESLPGQERKIIATFLRRDFPAELPGNLPRSWRSGARSNLKPAAGDKICLSCPLP